VTATATSYSIYNNENTAVVRPASFELSFLDACEDPSLTSLTAVEQVSQPDPNSYDGQTLTFTFTPFTVQPAWCDLSISCTGVSGPSPDYLQCVELDESGQVNWTFDGEDYKNGLKPGTYTYTYEVNMASGHTETFTVDVTLEDPCVDA
jgi:hypothetical protein